MADTKQHQNSVNDNGQTDNEDIDADAILAELEAEGENDQDNSYLQPNSTTSKTSGPSLSGRPTASIQQSSYTTLKSDDDTLRHTTEHTKSIVHFFHPDFSRCSIMDEHITLIAQAHADYGTDASETEVRFARVDVRDAEFVVQKLGVRVLPCVIGFVRGQVKGRIVGFEGVSWGGREKGVDVTRAMEEMFVEWGVLRRGLVMVKGVGGDGDESEGEEVERRTGRRGIQGRKQVVEDEGDDWD